MKIALLAFFLFLLLTVFLYSLVQLNLLFNYLKKRKLPVDTERPRFSNVKEVPFVTVQLPVYNEKNVMERLLKNIAKMDYPIEKLEIQVLDDSTDDSIELTARLIGEIEKSGLEIKHIRRTVRKDFKAGALKEGLKTAKGEFMAIFDSDFLPKKNWLKKTIPYFKDEKIGVVQTRWGHLNRNYSLLTKLQAFALDFHFFLEQNGRSLGKHFINFNGTAGIWRKSCILDAGNWQGDTLTEDLDLSYRAQLKNWKFKYLENIETPAELPITMAAAKSQQFRWNKGAAENFQKNYWNLLANKSIPIGTKIHGFFHLLNSSLFLLILVLAVLSVPVLFVISEQSHIIFVWAMSFFSLGTLVFFGCYWVTFSRRHANNFLHFLSYLKMFLIFFSVAMGFSVHNSRAVLEGHFGKKSEFVRTPKFNISEMEKDGLSKNRGFLPFSFQFALEISLMCYFAYAVYAAFILNDFTFIIFHLMLFFGFAYMVFGSWIFRDPTIENR